MVVEGGTRHKRFHMNTCNGCINPFGGESEYVVRVTDYGLAHVLQGSGGLHWRVRPPFSQLHRVLLSPRPYRPTDRPAISYLYPPQLLRDPEPEFNHRRLSIKTYSFSPTPTPLSCFTGGLT